MVSTAPDARLEEFCERATAAAAKKAERHLDYKPTDREGFWTFHCPLDGPAHDPHKWTGDPRARAKLIGGRISAGCSKCTSGKFDDAYVDEVLAAIGETGENNVIKIEFRDAEYRSHHYVTFDGRYEVQKTKVIFKDRRKKDLWVWKIRDPQDGIFATFRTFKPDEFRRQHYPEFNDFYNVVKLYKAELFAPDASYRVVVTEGEKDADTFNTLMGGISATGLVATTLTVPQPAVLSSHQRAVFANRDVVLIGDADGGGVLFVKAWHSLLAELATSVRVFPPDLLELTGGNDLTDHVAQQEAAGLTRAAIAQRLLEKIASLPLAEPPPSTDWRNQLLSTKTGGVKADSIGNAEIVLSQHPDLAGRIKRDIRLGEATVTDAPWGAPAVVGARAVAHAVCAWLERAEKLSLAPRALEAALNFDSVAPPFNPFDDLAEIEADAAALDDMFVKQFPLAVSRSVAVRAARVFWADFAAKMRGELVPQRMLLGIATHRALDPAYRLAGAYSLVHRGTINSGHLIGFARQSAVLVQISLDTVCNQRTAPYNLSAIFAPHVFNPTTQRRCPVPMFIAVGPLPGKRTVEKVDERILILELED